MNESCQCDGERPDLYEERVIKARKDHRCYECSGVIPKGEHYNRAKGMWDGEFSSFATCGDCKAMWCDLGCTCWVFGSLRDAVHIQDGGIMHARFMAVVRSRKAG